jgi:LPS-assembly lipoprotein
MMFKTNSSFIAIFILSVLLTACGFHLRGLADIPFKTIYVEGNKNPISQDVIRALKNNGVEITKEAEKAEVAIEIMNDTTVKRILSLGGGVGVVREFELLHVLTFRMRNTKNELWDAPQTIENRRDFSYNDSEILAKTYEETMLYENMRQDALRELIRRIQVYKPSQTVTEDNLAPTQ